MFPPTDFRLLRPNALLPSFFVVLWVLARPIILIRQPFKLRQIETFLPLLLRLLSNQHRQSVGLDRD